MAAAAEKQAELEAHFEKLNELAGAGQHQKVLKAVETSESCWFVVVLFDA